VGHAEIKEDIKGTWFCLSKQAIIITDYKEDGTFSGTYFTPDSDVKTTLSGNWDIDKEVLLLKYVQESRPDIKPSLENENQIIIKSKDETTLGNYYIHAVEVPLEDINQIVVKSNDMIVLGRHFTPVVEIKTSYFGNRIIDKDILTLKYIESGTKIEKIPLEDKYQIIIENKDAIVLQSLVDGIDLECSRVKFKNL